MKQTNRVFFTTACVAAIALISCGELGQVEQGLVVDYDAATGVMTLIADSNPGGGDGPRYDVLPPKVVRIPQDKDQMGPVPAAGKLVDIDPAAATAVIYDAAIAGLRRISFTVVELSDNVFADDPRVSQSELPRVDLSSGVVTLYSPRTRQLLTISVPAEILSLPRETWCSGDEVRYYFKDPAQALRLMNVTKTTVS